MTRKLYLLILVTTLITIHSATLVAGEVSHSSLIKPVPQPVGLDPLAVRLGASLFNETGLSGDGRISCASCHDLANGGADGLPFARGTENQPLPRNTPTVLNASLNFRQMLDGRARTLEDQVTLPLTTAGHMNSSWETALAFLRAQPSYQRDFATAGREINRQSVAFVIAEYERSLLTPDGEFDRYLLGEEDAIGPEAKEGLHLFQRFGCISCHQGRNLGGNLFQKMGVVYDLGEEDEHTQDPGRQRWTGKESDRNVFKVPGLRNIAETAPYFHDGSAATLEIAVSEMGHHQLGIELSQTEISAIVAFLRTLSGKVEALP